MNSNESFRNLEAHNFTKKRPSVDGHVVKRDLDKPGKLNHLGSLLQTPSKDTFAYDATLNKLS
jgi:hypothetical protein